MAQLVARTAGGREAAGSSPVTPTKQLFMADIKAVIFDAGGVLHESFGMKAELRRVLNLDAATVDRLVAKQIRLLGSGRIDESEFWRQVRSEYGVRKVHLAENLLGLIFKQTLKPHAPVTELIRELRENGIKLAVLSNTIEPHAKVLREAGVYDGFDFVLLSHELGMRKPDPMVYRKALSVLGTAPQATVFVDDDPVNVDAAKAAGMRGILFGDPASSVAQIRALALGR